MPAEIPAGISGCDASVLIDVAIGLTGLLGAGKGRQAHDDKGQQSEGSNKSANGVLAKLDFVQNEEVSRDITPVL